MSLSGSSPEFLNFRNEMQRALAGEFGEEFVCPFWGNQNAKIVSISQAPSLSVVRLRKPFADKSGERLRREWYKVSDRVFYDPNNFYFTAVGMFFPGKDRKGGDAKPPLVFARKWLREELSFLTPKLYLVIGRMAAEFFFPGVVFRDLIFNDQRIGDALAVVLPHPSPANIKWFKGNPEFRSERLPVVRRYIHRALG